MTTTSMWRDGHRVDGGDVAELAFAGFAHFTAMQVRAGAVRGLDLHLERLRDASVQLFGRELDDRTVRDRMRTAAVAAADCSMTVTVHAPEGEFVPAEPGAGLRITVRVAAPHDGPVGPLALHVVGHERFMPEVKHVGEGAKTHHLWRARAAGFDDAVYVDRDGRLSEATIWNLAFWDGRAVVWPRAEHLAGTTMQIVRRRLERMGVPQRTQDVTVHDLSALSAVVMNSWTPQVPVVRIGDRELPEAPDFAGLLRAAFAAEAPVSLWQPRPRIHSNVRANRGADQG